MADKIRWGLLAAANIAKAFSKGVQHSETGTLVAVASRSQEKADGVLPMSLIFQHGMAATKRCWLIPMSTPFISRRRTRCTVNGRSRPATRANMCCAEKPIGLNHARSDGDC